MMCRSIASVIAVAVVVCGVGTSESAEQAVNAQETPISPARPGQ